MSIRFTHSHAVVIGIDRYQHVRPLSTAVADARQLCAFLQEAHGYDDIVLLEDATREKLALELGERPQHAWMSVIGCCFTSPGMALPRTAMTVRKVF